MGRVGNTDSEKMFSLNFKKLFTLHSFFERLRPQKGQIIRPNKISCLWPSKWNWMIWMIFAYHAYQIILLHTNNFLQSLIWLPSTNTLWRQLSCNYVMIYMHHIKKKKDKLNKIYVNLARTWFHLSPFAWNIKSQNDNFSPYFVILSEKHFNFSEVSCEIAKIMGNRREGGFTTYNWS